MKDKRKIFIIIIIAILLIFFVWMMNNNNTKKGENNKAEETLELKQEDGIYVLYDQNGNVRAKGESEGDLKIYLDNPDYDPQNEYQSEIGKQAKEQDYIN